MLQALRRRDHRIEGGGDGVAAFFPCQIQHGDQRFGRAGWPTVPQFHCVLLGDDHVIGTAGRMGEPGDVLGPVLMVILPGRYLDRGSRLPWSGSRTPPGSAMAEAATTRLPASVEGGSAAPLTQALQAGQSEVRDGHRTADPAAKLRRELLGGFGRGPFPGHDDQVGPRPSPTTLRAKGPPASGQRTARVVSALMTSTFRSRRTSSRW